jgi:murein DD-endopeptidase MepM/ murein hydrolase activator NlpD
LRNDYKAGKKVKIGQNYDIDIKRAKAAELTKDLGLYVNDLILELDRQLMMGYDEELEELGFIKEGDYGSEWDKVRIRQFLLEDIGPDTIVPPSQERVRHERLQANAQAIRTRARGILDRMIRRSRVSINRAGRLYRRRVAPQAGGRPLVSTRRNRTPQNTNSAPASTQNNTLEEIVRNRDTTRVNANPNTSESTTAEQNPYTAPPGRRNTSRRSRRPTISPSDIPQVANYGTEVIRHSIDSSHDTQLKMLEIQTKILEASIVQTRLLEGGLNVNGVVIQRGGLYKGLRAGAGKLLSGMGGLLGGTAKLYGSLLGGIAGGIKGAFGIAGSVLGRVFQGVRYSDIYVKGNPRHPILLARDLRAGLYRDKVTGKVIHRIKDIHGPVVDSEGNEVITVEDINKGLYDIQGKPLLKGLANKVIGFYGAMLSPFVTVAKIANWTIKKTFSAATRDKDVYVLGETSPRLLARVMQAGGYRSSVTGKPIYSVRDIDGDVMDTTGEHVILSVSEMTKLVDRRGNPYRTSGEKFRDLVRGAFKYTIGMPFKMAWKLTKGTYKLGAGIIKGGAKLIGKIVRGFGLGAVKSLATSAAYGDLVSRNPELLINVHQNEILLSMIELLDARLPGGRRKRGDEDGDGYRDGSWQERLQALRNTHSGNAEKAKRGNPERAPRNEESGGGFLSKLMLGGLGGNILKLLGGKGGKGGMLARILGGGLLGTVASSLFGGSGEGGEEGGLSTSSLALGAAGAGLMTMPGTLFKAARGLGSLGVRAATSGGGLLLRGAMMAAPILGGLASAIGGIISAPVVLGVLGVSALGAGAYYLYKKYKGDRAGFLMLRMAQYGVLPDEKDRVEKILELEEELKDSVRINGEEVNITITQKKLTAIAGIFGITQANKEALNNWAVWVQNRFKPVFMKHSVMAFKYFGKTDLSLLDDKLEPDQKVDVLKSLAIPDNGSNYLRNYSPFGSELKTDYELTDMILNQAVVKAKEDQGGNFVTRWWKNTFGGTPEAPKKTEENTIPETIRAPGYKPADPKTAYSQLSREAKDVSASASRGYRRLGEQTNTVIRKPFNDTQSVTPVPATTANVTRVFPRNTPIVPDIPATNGKYYLPVRGNVTSAFGQRRAPVAGASTNHKGIDLKASLGTPVVAMANGVIIKREVQRGYGNIVYLQHAGGIVSKYAHLSRFQEGQMVGSRVSGGQIIGYAGATGRVSGPHLHFEIVDSSGRQIDPEQFLKGTNGGSGAVNASQEMIANQARRFANDDIDADDTPEVSNQATSVSKPAPATKPIPYSGGKAFNPNAGPKPSKSKEPVRANVPSPEPAQPIVRDTATRRQLQESTHREQVRTQASIESSRILSDLLEVNRSMLGHLASIDRKVGGSVAPPPKQQDVENPISMKANRNIGN